MVELVFYILLRMTIPSLPQSLLKPIAAIQHMERGKRCIIRQGPDGPYYNLQSWEQGRNVSRSVPRELVAALQENFAAYEQFQNRVEQNAQTIIERTRTERTEGLKKRVQSRAAPGAGPGD